MKRRDFFKQAGIGSAALISLPALAHALTIPEPARSLPQSGEPPSPFVVLLAGTYEPVVRCPDLGLVANPCDGTYSTVKIYRVSGPDGVGGQANRGNHQGDRNREPEKAIGNFYVSFVDFSKPVAYDLPGGAMAMVFTGNTVQNVDDGQGGVFTVGTFDLTITEGTGIYQSFVGGRNKMVDILHQVDADTFVEHCNCIISRR